MRTTINLDDDVLESAKMLAARERKPLGAVISGLLRRAVEPAAQTIREAEDSGNIGESRI